MTHRSQARAHKCRAIYLVTRSEAEFFGRIGYVRCMLKDVPATVRGSRHYALLESSSGTAMVKPI
jgi:N-acetylglutamate synthase-like GNAT family acetyltransferase